MPDTSLLDNPIWHSLRTGHSSLAIGDHLARRYPGDIGPLAGVANQSPEAYEAMRPLAGPSGTVATFLPEPAREQSGWTLIRAATMTQMIFNGTTAPAPRPLPAAATLRPLTFEDTAAMVGLAELTGPGPFRQRTATLGAFYGIFEGPRLLAMAGERTRPAGAIEISAVCTHPDARGRGYAYALVARVIADILEHGAVPFLHALADNQSAIRVYQRLGFVHRFTLHLGVYKNNG